MIRTQVLKHFPEAKEKGAKEMPGEDRLLEKRLRKVGMSESLRRRRSEEMTQSNTSSPRVQKYFLSPRGGDGSYSPPEWRDF